MRCQRAQGLRRGPHPSNLVQEDASPNILSVVVVDHEGGPAILIQTLFRQVALRVELQGVVAVQQVPDRRVVLQTHDKTFTLQFATFCVGGSVTI